MQNIFSEHYDTLPYVNILALIFLYDMPKIL